MIRIAGDMERRGFTVPLLIGGAAASLLHTALKIVPAYSGTVAYVRDAGQAAETVRSLLSDALRPRFLVELAASYREALEQHERARAAKPDANRSRPAAALP
jgi:5-methyltetrahydrofolate--homocysteine methyltransferase